MIWAIALGCVLLFVIYRWLMASPFAALLMFPIFGWLFWLIFLPSEPSRYEWGLDAAVALLVACLPCWAADNR